MPRASSITPELVAEVRERRATGEPWKAIARDLRQRGLPFARHTYWLRVGATDPHVLRARGVPEHRHAGQHAPEARSK